MEQTRDKLNATEERLSPNDGSVSHFPGFVRLYLRLLHYKRDQVKRGVLTQFESTAAEEKKAAALSDAEYEQRLCERFGRDDQVAALMKERMLLRLKALWPLHESF